MFFRKIAAFIKHHLIENRIIDNLKQIESEVMNIKLCARSIIDI